MKLIVINFIYFILTLPKMITISKAVKKLNKADIAFFPEYLVINPVLIGVHLKSPLMIRSLNKIYENLKNGKHLKISWDNISKIYSKFHNTTHGYNAESFTYVIELKTSVKGMKRIELNRKFFLDRENKFERLIQKYSGIEVQRNSKTMRQYIQWTGKTLFVVSIIAILLLVGDKLGFDVKELFKHIGNR